MLKQLFIENFKSWERIDLKLSSITGLFGTNSSGKSSILQFLLMLKQTKESTDRALSINFGSANTHTNLGSFHDAIFGHNEKLSLNWKIEWSLQDTLSITDTSSSKKDILFTGDIISQQVSVSLRKNTPSTNKLQYDFSNQSFSLDRRENRPSAFDLTSSGKNKQFRFIKTPGRVWDIPEPIKSYAFPDQAKTYHQNADLLSYLEFSYEKLIDSIFYLGPLREYPKREYAWSGSRPIDVGSRGERVVDALLAAKNNDEKRQLGFKKRLKPFEEIIAHWLKELGLIHSFNVSELAEHSNLYKVQVQKTAKSTPVLITDVGFGVSQLLPVLVLLYYVPVGSIVLLEQPEIHLHPAVQTGLADVIINVVKTRNVQVIVESHSEHLLRRLQLRVAEDEIKPDDIELYFCENKAGASVLNPLIIDIFGNIENWPQNFFGNEFEEIANLHKAGLKKRIENS